jgi:hypothetical protein
MKKLFDIQTGKYLELGNDWLDGREYIVLTEASQDDIDMANNFEYQKEALGYYPDYTPNEWIENSKNQKLNTTHELNTKWNGLFKDCVYGDRYVLINIITAGSVFKQVQYFHNISNFQITKLGFVPKLSDELYKVKVLTEGHKGNVNYNVTPNIMILDQQKFCFYHTSDSWVSVPSINPDYDNCEQETTKIGNLLEEYSKSLHGEKNKLKELEELIK